MHIYGQAHAKPNAAKLILNPSPKVQISCRLYQGLQFYNA